MSRSYMNRVVCTLALLLASGTALGQVPIGTTFTYPGNLQEGGVPVDDMCAFEFSLFAPVGGDNVGPTLTPTVTVSKGAFTVLLDFGENIFTGDARWLEISVRSPAGVGDPPRCVKSSPPTTTGRPSTRPIPST